MQQGTERVAALDDVVESAVASLVLESDPLIRYDALTRAQSVYEAVAVRVASERARAVADMLTSGLSYGRIAEVIGFTRARAQQLVERADPTPKQRETRGLTSVAAQEEITRFLGSYTEGWPRAIYSPVCTLVQRSRPQLMAERSSSEEIAAHLFANAEFRSLQLGTWLNTPNSQRIAAAVENLTPPLYREDIHLLTDAVTVAAKMQHDAGRERALAAGLVLAVGGALLAAGRS